MTSDRSRLNGIKNRWSNERKISAINVEWLIKEAENAERMRAANDLRKAGDTRHNGTADALSDLFGSW